MKQEEYNKKSKTEKRQKYNFETSKIQKKSQRWNNDNNLKHIYNCKTVRNSAPNVFNLNLHMIKTVHKCRIFLTLITA